MGEPRRAAGVDRQRARTSSESRTSTASRSSRARPRPRRGLRAHRHLARRPSRPARWAGRRTATRPRRSSSSSSTARARSLLGDEEHPVRRAASSGARPARASRTPSAPATRGSRLPRLRDARAERHRLLPALGEGLRSAAWASWAASSRSATGTASRSRRAPTGVRRCRGHRLAADAGARRAPTPRSRSRRSPGVGPKVAERLGAARASARVRDLAEHVPRAYLDWEQVAELRRPRRGRGGDRRAARSSASACARRGAAT